jgi:hypothetical protein
MRSILMTALAQDAEKVEIPVLKQSIVMPRHDILDLSRV